MKTTGHQCAQAGCHKDATHVVMESHPLAMLSKSGVDFMMCRAESHPV